MKQYKSKLDKEEQKKKEMGEDLDYLRNVDRPESMGGGKRFVVDKIKEEKKEEQDIKDAVASTLQSNSRTTYHNHLAAYGQAGLETLDWPPDWERYCMPTYGEDIRIYGKWFHTKLGIQIIVKDNKGDVYTRGVLTTMDPIIDMQNVDTLVVQAENTIDSAKGILLSDNKDTVASLRRTASGIWIS